jgi:hypothetical protein
MRSSIAIFALTLCMLAGPALLISWPLEARAEASEAARKAEWQQRYRSLVRSVEQLRTELEENRAAYSKAKQRDRLQGSRREQLVEQIASNEKRLAELETELAAFPDEARRAGVPPGWLRDIEG